MGGPPCSGWWCGVVGLRRCGVERQRLGNTQHRGMQDCRVILCLPGFVTRCACQDPQNCTLNKFYRECVCEIKTFQAGVVPLSPIPSPDINFSEVKERAGAQWVKHLHTSMKTGVPVPSAHVNGCGIVAHWQLQCSEGREPRASWVAG